MTASALALSLGLALIASAVWGPELLRRAAPALVKAPRVAVGVVGGTAIAWVVTLLAIGPMLAWEANGPALLPGRAAAFCQRCLASSSPFTTPLAEGFVPPAILLGIPAIAAAALLGATVWFLLRRVQATRRTSHDLRRSVSPVTLHGVSILAVPQATPFACTLPGRSGGIFISTGALELLTPDELRAVVVHEQAHRTEHHHLIINIAEALSRCLHWVPLIKAANEAIGHYLEIAADSRARTVAGTPALASALLKLSDRPLDLAGALNAAGSDRIRALVEPSRGRRGVLATAVVSAYVTTLAGASLAIHLPYAAALLAGCAV